MMTYHEMVNKIADAMDARNEIALFDLEGKFDDYLIDPEELAVLQRLIRIGIEMLSEIPEQDSKPYDLQAEEAEMGEL